MAEAVLTREAGGTRRLSFFFWMTVAMSLLVFGGFSFTYWSPLLAGRLAPAPPVVHVHGVLFSLWMVMLMVQAALVNYRQVALHRSIGTFGIALATALLLSGLLLTLLFGKTGRENPTADYYDLLYLSYMALIGFGLLFTLAIRAARQPESHRRLMLIATIPMLPPGINRLYMASLGLGELPVLATYLTMDALVAAIVIHDLRTSGKVSRATMIGGGFVLLQQMLHVPVAGSEAFAAISGVLTGLVYYR